MLTLLRQTRHIAPMATEDELKAGSGKSYQIVFTIAERAPSFLGSGDCPLTPPLRHGGHCQLFELGRVSSTARAADRTTG